MEANLLESKSRFEFCFEGNSEIDASLLANTIHDIADLCEHVVKQKDNEAYLKLKVTPFRSGSFAIDFSVVCQIQNDLLAQYADYATIAALAVTIIQGYFDIRKHLKGRKPRNIEKVDENNSSIINSEGQAITVNNSSLGVINQTYIEKQTVKIINYVREHNPKGGFALHTEDRETKYSNDDVTSMIEPLSVVEEFTATRETKRVELPIKKVDFTGKSMWDFVYGGRVIQAKMVDRAWIERVKSGKLSFKAGDYVRAELEVYNELDTNREPIPDRAKYTVVKVNGDICHEYQGQMTIEEDEGDQDE